MATDLRHPGVYIREVPSGERPITGVSTSMTAFVGRAKRGPVDESDDSPTVIHSFGDYDRIFGGLWDDSRMSFAVRQYFANGGQEALIVRVAVGAQPATVELDTPSASEKLKLEAASPGEWGNNLEVLVDHDTGGEDTDRFNLTVEDPEPDGSGDTETHRNLSVDADHARFVGKVLADQSDLVRLDEDDVPGNRPDETSDPKSFDESGDDGDDGNELASSDLLGDENDKTGVYALLDADIFNILCLPPPTADGKVDAATWADAAAFCRRQRAVLLVDPPPGQDSVSTAQAFADGLGLGDARANAALYVPRLKAANPLKDNAIEDFPPAGAVAGVYARTDSTRGVWKAPAGQEAALTGVAGLTQKFTDAQNGQLNPLGINVLRTFPVRGTVVWGARTLEGADKLASEWKYVPVRRTALFLQETFYRNLQWVVFEPNDHELWSQIRLNVGAFMQDLFRQGAFQGASPDDAYLVKCDEETTTPRDIARGVVNILVGFAPLRPAEFVVVRIQQLAGQAQS